MAAKTMSGAEVLIQTLIDQGVEVVFGYPGGAVLPIYDALFEHNSIRHILVRHEQGAIHAAEGYARASGKPGVVLVTSGPGATNTVTGLTDALMDSTPIVCLTGQVATHLIGTDAFQEADTVGITRACTKHNWLISRPEDLENSINEAFYVATSGRPGPVVVDLPKDIQLEDCPYTGLVTRQHKSYVPQVKGDIDRIREAVDLIASAERPIFYTGGGVINSGPAASQLLREFARLAGAPVTSTLMGLGAFPGDDEHFLGMLGMHGTYEANHAMHDCDVMVAIGARFDDRITGRIDAFSPNSKKIHVDIDRSSINKVIHVDVGIVGDCGHVLEDLIKVWKAKVLRPKKNAHKAWWDQIAAWRAIDSLAYDASDTIIKPQHAIERLYALSADEDPIITTEVGQHQMWAAQHFQFMKPNHFITSGGLGTMGYGLPAAVGAQLAFPKKLVIDIAGEASTLMNIQELGTAIQFRLPIKVFIINNQYMGMVRQWQELNHGGRYSQSYSESLPDFVKLAEAFGALGLRAEKTADLDSVIKDMIAYDGPVVADIAVDQEENCFPMVASGAAHNEMILRQEDTKQRTSNEGLALV